MIIPDAPMKNTLAKTIIFGSDKEVSEFLCTAPELNEIDEYGYTPLIQAAIVNSVTKTQMLLEAKAQVDFQDLTGRTALHWAASNGNRQLCELLLKFGADPNSYNYGGQPVLVVPLLKKQKPIYQLLVSKGASLNFAWDFINAKTLGHRFELEGRVDIVDTNGTFIEVELEGFYLEFSLELIINSLTDFRSNFGSNRSRHYFPKVDFIIRSLRNAAEILKYQHYLIDVDQYSKQIDALLDHDPLVLPISFSGHAITLVKFWEWMIRCDRGAFGRENGTTLLYLMNNPQMASKDFLRDLIYKRQDEGTINAGLAHNLGFEEVWQLPLSPQTSGNCTWANVEAVIPAMIFLLFVEERGSRTKEALEECQLEAMKFYYAWMEWDQNRAVHFCVDSFRGASPARKAAKAALLASILFQSCRYFDREDRERVEKILAIVTIPEYRYILQSYLTVLSKDNNNEMLKNITNFLDDYGVNLEDYGL